MALTTSVFEMKVEKVKMTIIKFASDNKVPSDVLIAALADVFGITAAVLDKEVGPQNIDDRLDAVVERSKRCYERAWDKIRMQIQNQHEQMKRVAQ